MPAQGDSSANGSEEDAKVRVFQPRRALPTDVVRPTRAEVHLDALRHNLALLRKAAGSTPIWGVLKADAYGHGAKAAGRTLERAGVDGLCVALVEEGIELRQAGIQLPVLVMGGYYGNAHAELVQHRLTPVLCDIDQVERLAHSVVHANPEQPFSCHIKVDTGMGRLGVRCEQISAFSQAIGRNSCLNVAGLMSHLANADGAGEAALAQPLRKFEEASLRLRAQGLHPGVRHLANSAALLRDRRTHFDLVRPGVALFGVDPLAGAGSALAGQLVPSMSVVSRVVGLRTLRTGDSVGYGSSFVAARPTVIATVPMGYADGLSRALSNRGQALVQGRRAGIVGNVSMDMVTLDVTSHPAVRLGDEVVFLGAQKGALGEDQIRAEDLAAWSGTIPWEVLTNISRRVPRFYREA